MHLDLSTLQKPLLHMDVSTPQGAGAAPGLVYTTKGCAAPGGVNCLWMCPHFSGLCWSGQNKGDRQQHSPVHLLYFEIFDDAECEIKKVYECCVCSKKRSTHAECALKKGVRTLSMRKKTSTQAEHAPKNCLQMLSMHKKFLGACSMCAKNP